MKHTQSKEVAQVFAAYPEKIRKKLRHLRQLILDVASENEGIGELEETLKWGEPSYLVKGGSTVRLGWKKSKPDVYAIYFNCNTKLVDTFKEFYADTFCFDGNRAIVFNLQEVVPEKALQHCIALSLEYHRLKHLSLLGA
ncbi:MAG: DUF1801 domain-containing protein [Gammaproteobacteria bacterium]